MNSTGQGSGNVEKARLYAVLATIVVNVLAVALLTLAPWSDWRTGFGLNLIDQVILLATAFCFRDRTMLRLLAFGLVVGVAELVADAWLVEYTSTLDYSPGGGPMLWRSPLWMPLAWQIVAVQFGVLGITLRKWRRIPGLLLNGVLGAINIPYYEEMARQIHWWRYSGCCMLSGTPYYIIVGELGIALGLAVCAERAIRGKPAAVLVAGIAGGALIFGCYATAFYLTDALWQPSR